jgi:hypothetical protein
MRQRLKVGSGRCMRPYRQAGCLRPGNLHTPSELNIPSNPKPRIGIAPRTHDSGTTYASLRFVARWRSIRGAHPDKLRLLLHCSSPSVLTKVANSTLTTICTSSTKVVGTTVNEARTALRDINTRSVRRPPAWMDGRGASESPTFHWNQHEPTATSGCVIIQCGPFHFLASLQIVLHSHHACLQ